MISTSITNQANCQRKSHRLTIPIQIIIEQKTYSVKNWSAHGFQVEALEHPLQINDTIDASLILPTGGASIVLNVQAELKNISNNSYGFEIVKISERNSRVLRHYASLAIDGNYTNIDDLSSDLFMTDVASPIKEPIALTEKESQKVHRSFLRRFFIYIIVAIIFLLLLLSTLVYNYFIVASSNGLVSGNAHYYNAPKDGLLSSLYVHNNQNVFKGELLYEMDTSDEKELLLNKKRQEKLLTKDLHQLQAALKNIQRRIHKTYKQEHTITQLEKAELSHEFKIAKQNYKRAISLFSKHLITSIEFNQIENQYLHYWAKYNELILHKQSFSKSSLITDQIIIKSQDQKINLQKMINQVALNIKAIKEEIITLSRTIKESLVVAQEDGSVHNIFHKQHSYLKFSNDVLVLETKQQPYILTKLLISQIDKVHIGEPCLIYSKRLDTFFHAHIVGMGYSITEGKTTNTLEISQNEIPIRIAFDNKEVYLHLNEYLKIYFLNASQSAQKMISILPKSFILL